MTEVLALRTDERGNAQSTMDPVYGAVDFMQWVIDDANRMTG
jgi:hypothetical protein